MFLHNIEKMVEEAERFFFREMDIAKEMLGVHHERDPRKHHHHKHHHPRGTILFEYLFLHIQILQPMQFTKDNGPFDGALVFKNAAGEVVDISKVTSPALSASGAGSVSLNPDGTFSGSGADGDLVLAATAVNDKGESITGTSTITFVPPVVVPDTTAKSVDVNVN